MLKVQKASATGKLLMRAVTVVQEKIPAVVVHHIAEQEREAHFGMTHIGDHYPVLPVVKNRLPLLRTFLRCIVGNKRNRSMS